MEGRRQLRILVEDNLGNIVKIGCVCRRRSRRSFCHFVTDRNRSTEFLDRARRPGSFPFQPPRRGTVVFAPGRQIGFAAGTKLARLRAPARSNSPDATFCGHLDAKAAKRPTGDLVVSFERQRSNVGPFDFVSTRPGLARSATVPRGGAPSISAGVVRLGFDPETKYARPLAPAEF